MRTKSTKNPNLMNRFTRICLVMVLTMAVTAIMPRGWSSPSDAEAAIAVLDAWTAAPQQTATTADPTPANFTVSAGSNRVLVVTVQMLNATGATISSVTFGGTALNTASQDTGNYRMTWIGWVALGDSATATTQSLAVTTGGTHANIAVYAASYSGVDQTNAISGSSNSYWNNAGTTCQLPAAVPVNAGGYGIYAFSSQQSYSSNTDTPDTTAYTNHSNSAVIAGWYAGVGSKPFPATTTTQPSITFATTVRVSISLATLNPVAGDSLSTSAPTNLPTGNPNEGASGVLMLAFQVDSNNADSGTVELSTLDINDAGNATSLTAHVYISDTAPPQTTLPGDAVLLGSTSGWDGSATTINLTGGMPGDRTVTSGTSRYIYIVYDIPSGQGTNTIQATVTGVGVASPDSGATGLNYQSTSRTVLTCNDGNLAVLTISNPTNGNSVGGEVTVTVSVGTEPSPSGMQNMQVLINGTWRNMTWNAGNWKYTWNTLADYPGSSSTPVLGVTIDAHGTDVNPCSIVVNASQISVNVDNTDPSKIASCAGCHGYTGAFGDGTSRNTPAGTFPGSHNKHAGQYSMACTVCHVNNTIYGHRNGMIEMTSPLDGKSGSYTRGSSFAQVNNSSSLTNCSNAYCHSRGAAGTSNPGETRTVEGSTSPVWGNNGTIDCTSCHGNETGNNGSGAPHYANNTVIGGAQKKNSHDSHTTDCQTCHNATTTDGSTIVTGASSSHANGYYNIVAGNGATIASYNYIAGGGVCNTISCHGGGNAQWGVTTVDCVTCHTNAIESRRAIMGEFGQTWNHGAADAYDCGVCHMEGAVSANQTTGKTDPAYHGNGTVELRDADTGTQIEGVTFGGTNAGQYTSTGSALSFTQFSRNLSVNLESDPAFGIVSAIQINHCLTCHDTDGSVVYAPGGSTADPFASGAPPLNIDAQFDTANASYHPIKGRQNNSYADSDTMENPWNQTTKTAQQLDQWGDLMSCFDCHAENNASGPQTSTVVAHGGADTLRANILQPSGQATALCVVCHQTAVYWTTWTHRANLGVSALNTDTPLDGWSNGGDHQLNQRTFYGCVSCHGTSPRSTSQPARPIRGENAHGFNTLANGTSTTYNTISPATAGARPWNFLRFSNNITSWRPRMTGATTNGACNGNNMCGRGESNFTYTPGGSY